MGNSPTNATDPSGHFADTLIDIGFIGYDIYQLATDDDKHFTENAVALGLDVAGALIPFVTGAGAAYRAGRVAGEVAEHADDALRLEKWADEAWEAGRAACSFTADTPVATADGAKPISAVQPGNQVIGYNQATGQTGNYTVTNVIVHTDPLLLHVTIDGETIVTTPEHPFSTLMRGWVDAAQLRPGDQVRQLDGSTGTVQHVVAEQRSQPMYDLTVDQAHTFFVGDSGWLVHNCKVRKGPFTEPELPPGVIAEERGVTIEHYYRGGDHGPPHVHVNGPGQQSTRIGQNGKPLANDPPLTPAQRRVVESNLSNIRNTIRKIGRWYWFNNQ